MWLDKSKTSPYKFYQYWLNSSDRDAERYIKIFTLLDQVRISTLIEKHNLQPHERLLQKTLAKEVTQMVHSYEDLEKAQKASNILFGKSTAEDLKKLDEESFLEVFEGVPKTEISNIDFENGIDKETMYKRTKRPIIFSSISLMILFSFFTFISFLPIREFGLNLFILTLIALFYDIKILPTILTDKK